MAARHSTGPLLANLLRRLQSLNAASVSSAPVALHSRHGFTTTTTTGPPSAAAAAAAERAPAAAVAEARARTTGGGGSGGHEALVRLPSDLVGAAEAFIGATGTSAKHAKQRAWLLGEALKRLSRSGSKTSSGGGGSGASSSPASATAAAAAAAANEESSFVRRTRSGRPRARDLAALGDVVAEHGAAALSEQDLALYVFGERGAGGRRGGGDDRGRNRRRLPAAAASGQEQQQQQQDPTSSADSTPMYDRADAAAYALVRLAPCYAACRAAMAEVAARLGGGGAATGAAAAAAASSAAAGPAFKPRRMLDFGAGPGTAVWAAQDVWLAPWLGQAPGDAAAAPLRTAHAVEPSAAMTALGRRLEAGRLASLSQRDAARARASGLPENLPRRPLAPSVSWAPSLAALRRRAAGGAGRRRYDLVACSYVVSEIAEASDRDRVVRALWDMVAEGGVLLLVDAGTPAGSAAVQRARALVLDVALRRAAKHDRRVGGGDEAAAAAAAMSASSAAGAASAEQAREEGGAYVVAPCPHDGACPMLAAAALRDEVEAAAAAAAEAGADEDESDEDDDDADDEGASGNGGGSGGWADSWCHFGQRLQRPAFMRSAKARPGARSARHDHQDERFSYVAIRRGRRPEPLAPGHAISLPAKAASGGGGGGGVFGAAGSNNNDAALLPLFAAVGEADFQEEENQEDEDERAVLDDQLLEAIDDMVSPSLAGERRLSLSPQSSGDDEDDADAEEEEDEEDEDDAAVPVSLGAGPGLVDRLVALDAAGVEWWRPEALAGLQQGEEQGAAVGPSSPSAAGASVAAAMAAAASAPLSLAKAVSGANDNDASRPVGDDAFRRRRDAQAALLAAAASGAVGWARLVRPPLKRGGHVVLDLCCAASAASSPPAPSLKGPLIRRPSPAPEGRLVRATVTRTSLARAWGGGGGGGGAGGGNQAAAAAAGAAAYSLARSLRWGDAMPLPPMPSSQQEEKEREVS